jgi:acyl-CoA thioesterase
VTAFDDATAVTPLGGGRFAAACDPAWDAPRGPNGGYLAAIVLRAMAAHLDDASRPARSVTLHYLRPPQAGAAEVEVAVERAGRTLSTLTARLSQDARVCVLATAAFAGAFPVAGPVFADPMPEAPRAGELDELPAHPLAPPIRHRFRMRHAIGPEPFSGGGEALTGGWMALHEPQPLDAPALAFFADAWLPPVFARLQEPLVAPTIDLTIHFRDPVAALAVGADEEVLGVFRTGHAADGFAESDGELWSPGGVLLAHSRQLMLLLPLER